MTKKSKLDENRSICRTFIALIFVVIIIVIIAIKVEEVSIDIKNSLRENTATTENVSVANFKPTFGTIPLNGMQPLFNKTHSKGDAIFTIAFKKSIFSYTRLIGTLRSRGYSGDIVVGTEFPIENIDKSIVRYIHKMNIIVYDLELGCSEFGCLLYKRLLGYSDPLPPRPLIFLYYSVYEYWLRQYSPKSYIIIADFDSVYFQSNPFKSFGPLVGRVPTKHDLRFYALTDKIKEEVTPDFDHRNIIDCIGKSSLNIMKGKNIISNSVIVGSYSGILVYVQAMITAIEKHNCWEHGILSDQEYINYIYYHKKFGMRKVKSKVFLSGTDLVKNVIVQNITK